MLPLTSFAKKDYCLNFCNFLKILQFSELLPEFLQFFLKFCNYLNT